MIIRAADYSAAALRVAQAGATRQTMLDRYPVIEEWLAAKPNMVLVWHTGQSGRRMIMMLRLGH
ncbi:hypothetical protein ACVIWV_009193 [Bradyrhizobium diazoefficiens]|jgi:hypothetical protein|nr:MULTISPECIES: hypothetical protein [Bradyrhizobium]MBR0867777.1 hypothetical protein [Bradyrhizobium diazoefficiens]MBR0892986.1 hypothetical protein [Bradyrhizobium diazoefficiens]MBR0924676.1 hypothetical protein [Bradyrhizobium diazoefficiens]MDA9488291.1 hypothetical protein [Bradyrhizobium sp. CCBAU 11361]MDA9541138.1 hypothetical protein [Bradyrhizobium sp. CCBAU 21362]